MTDEQLEKQISEEFEKWARLKTLGDIYDVDGAKEAFKAAALPLMKKIEELVKELDVYRKYYNEWALVEDSKRKLQKENEELKLILKEAIRLINEARWDNNDTPYPKHELIEWNKKFNLDKENGPN